MYEEISDTTESVVLPVSISQHKSIAQRAADAGYVQISVVASTQSSTNNEQSPLFAASSVAVEGAKESSSHSVRFLVLACVVSLVLMVIVFANVGDRASLLRQDPLVPAVSSSRHDCLGPPYLYVTLHDKVSNVLKFSRNGCLIDDHVLLMEEAYDRLIDVQFRSLSVGKQKDHDALFIADASKHNSRLLIFGKCIDEAEDYERKNKRHFIEIIADRGSNPGLDHSYGVCHDSHGNVYVSNQHTESVLRFAVNTWEPMPLPAAIQLGDRLDYFQGTFVQFGMPNKHAKGNRGVRALAHVGNRIWIAHESMSGVVIADVDSGQIMDFIQVDTPIGLYHLKEENTTFVSCKSKERGGIVYAINVNSFKIENEYVHHRMTHPTGMTSYGGILYVAEQMIGAIMSFDVKTEQYLGTIVEEEYYIEQLEQIALSPC